MKDLNRTRVHPGYVPRRRCTRLVLETKRRHPAAAPGVGSVWFLVEERPIYAAKASIAEHRALALVGPLMHVQPCLRFQVPQRPAVVIPDWRRLQRVQDAG